MCNPEWNSRSGFALSIILNVSTRTSSYRSKHLPFPIWNIVSKIVSTRLVEPSLNAIAYLGPVV